MMATPSTPRLEFIDNLVAADHEIVRLVVRLRALDRRRVAARRQVARPAARPALGAAYLGRAEYEYEVTLSHLHAAYRDAQVLLTCPRR